MNPIRLSAALAASFVLLFVTGCVTPPPPATVPGNQAVAIEDVISQVQSALANAQTSLADKRFPPLKQVKLSLQTVATKKDGVTLKLWVLSFGSTVEKTSTQQMDLTLVPPPAGLPKKVAAVSLTEDLESAIISAAEGVQKARTGTPPLELSTLDVQIGFTVKGDVNGGPNVTLAPITLGLTGDVASSNVQVITVSFATKGTP